MVDTFRRVVFSYIVYENINVTQLVDGSRDGLLDTLKMTDVDRLVADLDVRSGASSKLLHQLLEFVLVKNVSERLSLRCERNSPQSVTEGKYLPQLQQ